MFKQVEKKNLEGILAFYPHIKVAEGKYISFEDPGKLPMLILRRLKNIFYYIGQLVVTPFLIIWEVLKIVGLFMPLFLKEVPEEKVERIDFNDAFNNSRK